MQELLEKCILLALRAGEAVMEIYESADLGIETKADSSPLTSADKLANRIIEDGLKSLSGLPIISEEGDHQAKGNEFWLVDPIDGTKEFIAHNGEFTINIGLIKNSEPVLGVVYAPAKELLYYAAKGLGAFKIVGDGTPVKIKAEYKGELPAAVVSRSHPSKETTDFLKRLGPHKLIKSGSSLKMCLVAEGVASIYPRFSPTHIWDTAASDAILREAKGQIKDVSNQVLKYEPNEIINPYFVARTIN